MDWNELINSRTVWALVAITWLVVSAVVKLVRMHYRHVERLAMIDRGLVPDGHSDEL